MDLRKVYDAFGPVPSGVAPSTSVRRWDHAALAALLTFVAVYAGVLALGWLVPNPSGSLIRFPDAFVGGLAMAGHWAMGTLALEESNQAFVDLVSLHHPGPTWVRVGAALGLGVLAAFWAGARAARPLAGVWHVAGPEVLEGEAALAEARHRSMTAKEAEADPFAMALHPDLKLSKKHWSRHVLIYGSVGSGKSVILKFLLAQLVRNRRAKLFCYDVKGDFTSLFKRPIVVSPFDARSHVWDVAADVRTPSQAAAFAASLIPEGEGNARFWSIASQDLLIGCVRELQQTKPGAWTWSDLAQGLRRSPDGLLAAMTTFHPRAAPLLADAESATTASLLASLSGFTRLIDDLALAWPTVGERRFAMTEWLRDDGPGRKQVIVQSGPDPTLTKAYIAAMINVAVPHLISPTLPDDEEGRGLYFVFDELTSAGRLNIDPLLALGRSKGVVAIMAVQDLAQVEQVYGEKTAQAFASLVGTHVVCQVQMGSTRDRLAQLLGKRKVAWRAHAGDGQVHEESRALVSPAELTDRLGFRRGKRFGPQGWGIRALVQMGGDVLLLDWPGQRHRTKRVGQVPATWVSEPAKGATHATPVAPKEKRDTADATWRDERVTVADLQAAVPMTEDEIDALFQRRP